MKRTLTLVLFGALALVGCRDMGLDENSPVEEAMARGASSELVAEVMVPTTTLQGQLIADGKLWVPHGLPLEAGAGDLRAVGSSGGETIYARSWDDPPYDELFTRVATGDAAAGSGEATLGGESYQPYAPVIGGRGLAASPPPE